MEEIKFLKEEVKITGKITNDEISLAQFFAEITGIYPFYVVIYEGYLFFFVEKQKYLKCKQYLKVLRKKLKKKIMIIRFDESLLKLVFGFFPDVYIHDLSLVYDYQENSTMLFVYFLTFQERGVAIGRLGKYIKIVNAIFRRYIRFKEYKTLISMQCEVYDSALLPHYLECPVIEA